MSRLTYRAAAVLLATTSVAAGQQPVPTPPTTTARSIAVRPAPRVVASGRATSLTTIQGNALDSMNGQLVHVVVRLRDARFGRIVDTEFTDQSGLFAFRTIDPGSYIVELMGNDSSVLAASQILNVEAGEIVSALVKLPFNAPAAGALLGANSATTATVIVTEAVANGVVAVIATDPVSPIE